MRLLLAVLLVFVSSCSDAASGPPHLILVVIDTLRTDHVGAYGYHRPTTPNLDALANEGTRFARAYAPSSWTRPSVGSLFTSRWPSEHGAVAFAQGLDPAVPTLAEALRAGGYATVGVSANFVHVNEQAGFARGFDTWVSSGVRVESDAADSLLTVRAGGSDVRLRAWEASEVNREVLSALPRGDERPVFLYVHYMEPHSPYSPPERERLAFRRDLATPVRATNDELIALAAGGASEVDRDGLVDLYDAEIAAVDASFGELLAALAVRGFLENAVVAVASDHGEELADHGGWFHALTLYREVLSVPLVLRDFRSEGEGSVRDEPVDLLDLPVTLLHLASVDPPPGMRGRDLLDALRPRSLVAQLHPDPPFEEALGPRRHRVALIEWPWKAIGWKDGTTTAYQLERDPRELAPTDPVDHAEPPALLQKLRELSATADLPGKPLELDEAARDGLRALGYVR